MNNGHRYPFLGLATGFAGALIAMVMGAMRAPAPGLLVGASPTDSEPVSFQHDVRPILTRACLACHGFDPSTREAGIRLDTYEGATAERSRGRRPAIVPGDPDASLLLEMVSHADPNRRMPPEGEPLTDGEIETLRAWIDQGARYEKHWSLEPIVPHRSPVVADPAWNTSPIDRFVRARQVSAGLDPGTEADRRALIRRLSFDLTGLPPGAERVESFVADDRPDAYGRLVDELLASRHFGERWARHWLDLVRYAETYAHEFDYAIRHAHAYRDYVIRAFNADVPYDRFVTEHIAGDVVPEPRRHPVEGFNESVIGTGFWWMSQGTHAPVDVLADEAERLENQIDVMSKTFLATTVACARCHDHKFDPVTTKEYYGLAAFVQSSRRQEAYLDPYAKIDASVQEMRRLAAAIEAEASESWGSRSPEQFASELTGVRRVFFGTPGEGEPIARAPRTIADFDAGTYDGWTVEGDAFTDIPTVAGDGRLEGEGTARGSFANTHRRLEGEGSAEADHRTGRITSEPFEIDRNHLRFLIGGGDHPGKTGLRVLVEGEVVGEATGHNNIRLREESIDLSAHLGKSATIEIFDEVTGGWGNIRVDEIVLADHAPGGLPRARSVEAVAAEVGCDTGRLAMWADAVEGTWDTMPRDLRAWIEGGSGSSTPHAATPTELTLFDFSAPAEFGSWFASGWAFGEGASSVGDLRLGAGSVALATAEAADSGRLADRLMGTLRSPTFEVTDPYLAVWARGRGTLRVIVDGYTMDEYNALLFNRAKLDVDTESWGWRVHDLRKRIGHRAHYEIIDDRTDGAIEVGRAVWLSDDRTPAWRPDEGRAWASDAEAIDVAGTLFGAFDADARPVPGAIDAANWVLAAGLLDLPDRGALSALAEAQAACPTPRRALAMEDGTGNDGHVYVRGDHNQLGDEAPRAFLAALVDDPVLDLGPGSGRLALAERMLDESNPYTARVMVNRVWAHLMGAGLVETVDDFGLLGKAPTHPELLDHLAHRFRTEMGWSVKTLIREIVTSRAYRTATGEPSERAGEVDPLNHLLTVRAPRRLDGEAIRDAILAVSGELDPTMYGPSVPIHLTSFMTGRGRPGQSGPLDGRGRRSIYIEVRRNFLSPMMQAFDAPNPHSTVGERNESNVPAQSLILMNDPFVVDQAEKLAGRLLDSHADSGERVRALYTRALGRAPDANETALALAFVDEQAGAGGSEQAAWADLCHVVFNLKEFSFVE